MNLDGKLLTHFSNHFQVQTNIFVGLANPTLLKKYDKENLRKSNKRTQPHL